MAGLCALLKSAIRCRAFCPRCLRAASLRVTEMPPWASEVDAPWGLSLDVDGRRGRVQVSGGAKRDGDPPVVYSCAPLTRIGPIA